MFRSPLVICYSLLMISWPNSWFTMMIYLLKTYLKKWWKLNHGDCRGRFTIKQVDQTTEKPGHLWKTSLIIMCPIKIAWGIPDSWTNPCQSHVDCRLENQSYFDEIPHFSWMEFHITHGVLAEHVGQSKSQWCWKKTPEFGWLNQLSSTFKKKRPAVIGLKALCSIPQCSTRQWWRIRVTWRFQRRRNSMA